MSEFEWITVLLSVIGVILIPLCILIVHLVIRWTKTDDKLNGLISDVKELVDAKEKVHTEMYRQMREDRAVADKRLRWLEENLWNRKRDS